MSMAPTHLFVHEDVDEGVDDGAALGQQRRHHAGHRADDVGGSECRHHGHHAIRHPAQQVAGRRGQNHEQYVVLSLPRCRLPDLAHLRTHMSLCVYTCSRPLAGCQEKQQVRTSNMLLPGTSPQGLSADTCCEDVKKQLAVLSACKLFCNRIKINFFG